MGKGFIVKSQKFVIDLPEPQDVGDKIESWLEGLDIPNDHTVYEISIIKESGFLLCNIVYER